MSTVKTNNVQVGQSGTATNNFTWYQPSTPDGTVRLGVGNTGATTADVVTANSSGNVGIGTSSPAYKLQVNGFVGVTDGTSTIRLANSGGVGLVSTITNHPLAFQSNDIERGRFDTSGNFQFNSGYGSVATAYGCRAWVNFNGKNTIAIRASGNVSSLTDNGVGNYTVNFTNALPDTNYAAIGTARYEVTGGGADYGAFLACYSLNTSNVSIYTSDNASANTAEDEGLICVTIFR